MNGTKSALPCSLTDALPTLESGEAVLIGDAVVMPSLVNIDRSFREPSSTDIPYLQEWKRKWHDVEFPPVIKKWEK